jgi:phosphoglycolate phosphatase
VKVILFDIDGTIMLGHGAGTRAMTRAGRTVCGPAFDLDGIMIGGGLDPVIFDQAARRMGIAEPELLHDAFRARYLDELRHELENCELRAHVLPGVVELLDHLTQRADVVVGLVTGNYQLAVPIKFGAVGLPASHFIAGGFGDDARARPGLVPIALGRVREVRGVDVAMDDVIIVGDTPRDVDCALQNGCRCLAVATGHHPRAELEHAGAHRVIDDLRDPQALLSWL